MTLANSCNLVLPPRRGKRESGGVYDFALVISCPAIANRIEQSPPITFMDPIDTSGNPLVPLIIDTPLDRAVEAQHMARECMDEPDYDRRVTLALKLANFLAE